jgi:hypothetical protein
MTAKITHTTSDRIIVPKKTSEEGADVIMFKISVFPSVLFKKLSVFPSPWDHPSVIAYRPAGVRSFSCQGWSSALC